MMSSRARFLNFIFGLAGLSAVALVLPAAAQTNYYGANGTEYAVVGSLPGDQVFPDAAISPTNGFVVWQDNATDGDGWGISARRLDALSNFRVNAQGANDQEKARVALLKNGGAVFVWQGGVEGYQHVFARFLTPTNTFLTTTDLAVSTFASTASFQVNPAVAVLNNSNVVVVWSSFNQAGSNTLQDVYAKILSPAGATAANEFLVNETTSYNQRSPVIAALKGGGFVVAWVSEQPQQTNTLAGTNSAAVLVATTTPSVHVFARIYQSNGVPAGGEFRVDEGSNPCANPNIAAASDGSFMLAWSGRDMASPTNAWDVFARPFSNSVAVGPTVRLNTYLRGSQYAPRLSAIGLDYLAVWTSLGQDGSREGVYGQFVHSDGSLVRGEFRVNTSTVGQQMQPAVAADGAGQFLVVWTSYTGSPYSFDLFAQRYVNAAAILQPMSAPFVWAPFVVSNYVYQPRLVVSWATLFGLSVSNYEVYVDGATTPVATVTTNQWTMTAANGLTAGSTHSFQVDYVMADGRQSPKSPSASGTTWNNCNYMNGGVPCDWVAQMYATSSWPSSVNAPLVPGGLSLLQVFLSGGNPLDPSTWLKTQLTPTAQGLFLNWNTQPGATYQVQMKTSLPAPWTNLPPPNDGPRFAAGTTDSIHISGGSVGYYRVVLLR